MPEYLAPGVYVEETSFRSKSIEGVSTTTTGFIGPTRSGPIDLPPDIITSLGEFERVYGGRQQLQFKSKTGENLAPMDNYLWHAVRAFFEEGGKRLYVVRTFKPIESNQSDSGVSTDGCDTTSSRDLILIRARFPGDSGGVRVRMTLNLGQNVLTKDEKGHPRVRGLQDRDVVWISDLPSHLPSPLAREGGRFYIAESFFDANKKERTWKFTKDDSLPLSPLSSPPESPPESPLSGSTDLELSELQPNAEQAVSDLVRIVTVTVSVEPIDGSSPVRVWNNIPLDPLHKQNGTPDSLFDLFAERFASPDRARSTPIVFKLQASSKIKTGVDVLDVLFHIQNSSTLRDQLNSATSTDDDRSIELRLTGGNDGQLPGAEDYEGSDDPASTIKTGLKAFEDIEDISIVAAPGSTYGLEQDRTRAQTIINHLITHATKMRYRIAIVDSGDGQSISAIREFRAKFDTTYAAMYYPWVRVLDPLTNDEIFLPPSGFVAGIYARNDVNRAVYKAPANEVVNLALGFEQMINKAQQEVLNPEGINCFRFFPGRGNRLWGARTMSSDSEWKYVNVRRYFAYLEHSIDKGTQFAVFEPNGDALWANIRRTIEDFLLNEWQSGALLGEKPEKAYFVRCDRSTMTQNDLDNGRLICLIGVAPLRPAEFVIFRIGQFTADRKA